MIVKLGSWMETYVHHCVTGLIPVGDLCCVSSSSLHPVSCLPLLSHKGKKCKKKKICTVED